MPTHPGSAPDPDSLLRPQVRALHPYVPGEQPAIRRLIKLNTNENPYPPSPRVLKAVRSAADGRLRLYPSATADRLRTGLAKMHGCKPENVIVGNGSDELLAMSVRCFVEPSRGGHRGKGRRQSPVSQRGTVQYFTPSYSLYPVLADIHGAHRSPVPLTEDFGLPPVAELKRNNLWDFGAALTLVTTPNAPTGRGYSTAELDSLCGAMRGVIVLDEAYVDFARQDAMDLALKHPHVLVARTFSKAYSLCFLRVGYLVGHPVLISALQKIRDSYNVNGLGQVAAEATLGDLTYYRRNFRRVIATREKLREDLGDLGFEVFPSETNFVLSRPPVLPAREWRDQLRERGILVRWFDQPGMDEYLRISIGTESEATALVRAARVILKAREKSGRRQARSGKRSSRGTPLPQPARLKRPN